MFVSFNFLSSVLRNMFNLCECVCVCACTYMCTHVGICVPCQITFWSNAISVIWIICILILCWSVVSNFSQIYEILCRDKTYLKITHDILSDILSVTNMMAIGNLEVMPDKIKHCKKLCTEMDCFTNFNWFCSPHYLDFGVK